MDRKDRWDELKECEIQLRDLSSLYQNNVPVISKGLYESEVRRAKAVRDKINKAIDNYISDLTALSEVVQTPKTFKDKLMFARKVFEEMANENGCDGDEYTASYFCGCIDVIDTYLKDGSNEENLIQELSVNSDIIKLKGLPKTVVDLKCSVKIVSNTLNNSSVIKQMYLFLRTLINNYGINQLYLDIAPDSLHVMTAILKRIKSEFKVSYVFVAGNQSFNTRWNDRQLNDFAQLLSIIDKTEFTDDMFSSDKVSSKNNFIVGSSRVICYIGDDEAFITKCLNNERKLYVQKDNKIVRQKV